MIMQSNLVEVKVTEPVATVLLNRANKGNALTRSMILELGDALRDVYQEKRVRAIVLTGSGDVFCAGRDLGELASNANPASDPQATASAPSVGPQQYGAEANEFRQLILDMLELPKPIIASVNGPALASGAGLVLASDLVVAGPSATFGLPEARCGLVSGIVAPLLAHRLGAGAAARLALSAEPVTAAQALDLGIYHETVDADLLWARASEIGRTCAAAAPEAIALTKRLLFDTVGEQLATQLTSGAIASATARTTDSAKEGVAAFLAKREPSW